MRNEVGCARFLVITPIDGANNRFKANNRIGADSVGGVSAGASVVATEPAPREKVVPAGQGLSCGRISDTTWMESPRVTEIAQRKSPSHLNGPIMLNKIYTRA
jgi:hypothetical protein